MRKPKQQKPLNDLSRSLTPFDPNQTLIAVIELSQKSWLIAGIIPGVERQPLKKREPDENQLLKLLGRWRTEVEKVGRQISRIAVAFETGRDGPRPSVQYRSDYVPRLLSCLISFPGSSSQ